MKLIKNNNDKFYEELKSFLFKRIESDNEAIQGSVKTIIDEVKRNGDNALFKYAKEFDGVNLENHGLLLDKSLRDSYKSSIDKGIFSSFKKSIENVRKFHKLQYPKNYKVSDQEINIESQ